MKFKNIPNILSCIRILLVFVFVFVFFVLENTYLALIIFLVAGATDIVDGYLGECETAYGEWREVVEKESKVV